MSPSMENTPSLMRSLRPGTLSNSLRISSALAVSLCGKDFDLGS